MGVGEYDLQTSQPPYFVGHTLAEEWRTSK
jgi:hypothetical protein